MCASWSGQRAAVKLLLQHGAAWVGVVDMQGRDATHLAVEGIKFIFCLNCVFLFLSVKKQYRSLIYSWPQRCAGRAGELWKTQAKGNKIWQVSTSNCNLVSCEENLISCNFQQQNYIEFLMCPIRRNVRRNVCELKMRQKRNPKGFPVSSL